MAVARETDLQAEERQLAAKGVPVEGGVDKLGSASAACWARCNRRRMPRRRRMIQ